MRYFLGEEKGVTDLVHGGWCSIAEVRFSRRGLVLFIFGAGVTRPLTMVTSQNLH